MTQQAYDHEEHATPDVSWTSDPTYRWVATMVDGLGTWTYAYHAAGSAGGTQLASIDGPRSSDTLTYSYDELGRWTNRPPPRSEDQCR